MDPCQRCGKQPKTAAVMLCCRYYMCGSCMAADRRSSKYCRSCGKLSGFITKLNRNALKPSPATVMTPASVPARATVTAPAPAAVPKPITWDRQTISSNNSTSVKTTCSNTSSTSRSTNNIGSRKRKYSSSSPCEHPLYQDRKRSKTESRSSSRSSSKHSNYQAETKTFFISDSQFQLIAKDQMLQAAAWERHWSLRMRRGGLVNHIEQMIRRHFIEEDVSRQGQRHRLLVVSVGGNDISNACQRAAREADARVICRTAERLGAALEEAANNGAQVIWLQVAPRKDLNETARRLFNRVVCDSVKRHDGIRSIDLEEGRWNFVRCHLKRDGIHYNDELMWSTLNDLMRMTGQRKLTTFASDRTVFMPPEARMCHECGRRSKHSSNECRD